MKLVPLGQNVVIKPIEPDATTPGGLHLPQTIDVASHEGRVLSIGDGRLLSNGRRAGHQVHEGDRVVFAGFSGTQIVIDGEELLILPESNILAVVGGANHKKAQETP